MMVTRDVPFVLDGERGLLMRPKHYCDDAYERKRGKRRLLHGRLRH